jgi:hypothetical protein
MAIWYKYLIYCHLVGFVVIWYIFPSLVCLEREKSGNPARARGSRFQLINGTSR